jgi:small subunit ribosomal protein S16
VAVMIRLKRIGAKGKPQYKIIAIDKEKRRDGKPLEVIGFYDPINNSKTFVNKIAAENWIKKGAIPSLTVASIIKKFN